MLQWVWSCVLVDQVQTFNFRYLKLPLAQNSLQSLFYKCQMFNLFKYWKWTTQWLLTCAISLSLFVALWLTGNCSSVPSTTSEATSYCQPRERSTQKALNVCFCTTIVNSNWVENCLYMLSLGKGLLKVFCAKLLQLCSILCDPMDHSPPGSSIHVILQAAILEWVAIPSSRGSSQPRDWIHVSYRLLHWQVGSLPLYHLNSVFIIILKKL